MLNTRVIVYFLALIFILNCVTARTYDWEELVLNQKRLFGCAQVGKSCKGLFSSSCCSGLHCHQTTGHCVGSGSGHTWLDDRNGK